MKKMKKFLSMLLAMAMVLGMSVTTFAAGEAPSAKDHKSVTISGTTDNTSLKAYRIIEPDYNENGLTGYSWVAGTGDNAGKTITIKDEKIQGLDTDLLVSLAGNAAFKAGLETAADTDGNYKSSENSTIDLTAGMWLVLATDGTNPTKVYNPMLLSVFYTKNDTEGGEPVLTAGSVSAGDRWSLYTDENVFAKSTDITDDNNTKKTVKDSATGEVGTKKEYTLAGVIPSYSEMYFDNNATVVYTMKDSIGNGLKYTTDLAVYVGNSTTPLDAANYTLTYYTADDFTGDTAGTPSDTSKSFTVAFTSDYIKTLASLDAEARKVRVVYNAEITAAAVVSPAENTFVLEYTRTPGQTETKTNNTVYTYTAKIDGAVKKTDGKDLLGNAEFTLYREYNSNTKELSKPFGISTTAAEDSDVNVKGSINFSGLEFNKTYYLQETNAPDGFSINDTVFSVVCKYPTTMDADDLATGKVKLTEYTVTITNLSDNTTQTVTVPYDGSKRVLATNAYEIVNTTLASLPSTGGIGTTIFTIGGCAIMIIAAGLYFSLRRRTER